MAIAGTWRLGYIDGRIVEPLLTDDPRYAQWQAEYTLPMTWILNSMEHGIAASFHHCQTAKELSDSMFATYVHKKNHAIIYQSTRNLGSCWSPGEYHAKHKGMWCELSLYQPRHPCCAKEQQKELETADGTPWRLKCKLWDMSTGSESGFTFNFGTMFALLQSEKINGMFW